VTLPSEPFPTCGIEPNEYQNNGADPNTAEKCVRAHRGGTGVFSPAKNS
jgi:hypothetical protein